MSWPILEPNSDLGIHADRYLMVAQMADQHGLLFNKGKVGDRDVLIVKKGDRQFFVRTDHVLYAGDLITHFDYYFGSTVPQIEDGVRTIDYSQPKWHELSSGEKMFYTSFAEDTGATVDYLNALKPREGETVLDVGAYCGFSTIAFSRAVGPRGKVFAFEPDPANFAALKANLAQAGIENVIARNAALSAKDEPLRFSAEGNMGSAIVEHESSRGRTIEVAGERLRSLLASGAIASFDVVKLDIEGAEYDVLEDSLDVIRNSKARWAIELHADPSATTGIDVDRIRSLFDLLGYQTQLQAASSSAAAPTLFAFPSNLKMDAGERWIPSKALRDYATVLQQQHLDLAKAHELLLTNYHGLEAIHGSLLEQCNQLELANRASEKRWSELKVFSNRLKFALTGEVS